MEEVTSELGNEEREFHYIRNEGRRINSMLRCTK